MRNGWKPHFARHDQNNTQCVLFWGNEAGHALYGKTCAIKQKSREDE